MFKFYGVTQSGFSLLEVLIAWMLSMTIMLSILLYMNTDLRATHHRYLQSLALVSLQNMLERLHVNQTMAAREREQMNWNQQNQSLLPNGHGQCDCVESTRNCQVTVTWWESELQSVTIAALI